MINIAVIGAGRMGQIYCHNVAKNEHCKLVYVVGRTLESASKLAHKYQAPACTEISVVINNEAIDAIIIASPTPTHLDIVTMAAKAGKAVFCEKPIDLDIHRVDQCLQTLAQYPVPFMLGFNRRFDPQISQLRQRVLAGDVGHLNMLLLTSRDPCPPPVNYLQSSGGYFIDSTVHDIDLICWISQELPLEVMATGSCLVDPKIGELGDIDTSMTMMLMPSGTICHVNNSRRSVYGFDQRIEAFGSKGMLQTQNQHQHSLLSYSDTQTNMASPLEYFFLERYQQSYRIIIDEFIDAVENKKSIECNQFDGRNALAIALACNRSVKERKAIAPVYS